MSTDTDQIASFPSQGYFLVPAIGGPHILGGDQNLAGALSPNSGRRLLQLARISTTDPRLYLQAAEFEGLPLLYSWTCDIHRGEFTYRVDQKGIEILAYEAGSTVYTKFPYKDYPDSFAAVMMDLVPIDASEQQIILGLNDRETRRVSESAHEGGKLDQPMHQLGGIPRLMQDEVSKRKCPRCAGQMPLFASIADDNGTPRGFTNNPYVQVIYHLCRACWIVNCYNLSD